jgi:hypothetical protein
MEFACQKKVCGRSNEGRYIAFNNIRPCGTHRLHSFNIYSKLTNIYFVFLGDTPSHRPSSIFMKIRVPNIASTSLSAAGSITSAMIEKNHFRSMRRTARTTSSFSRDLIPLSLMKRSPIQFTSNDTVGVRNTITCGLIKTAV